MLIYKHFLALCLSAVSRPWSLSWTERAWTRGKSSGAAGECGLKHQLFGATKNYGNSPCFNGKINYFYGNFQ